MTLAAIETMSTAHKAVLESFLAISNIYLRSTERLNALNATAMRVALADAATVVAALSGTNTATEFQQIQSDMGMAMIGKVLAYTRNLHEIAAETQDEMTRLIHAQVAAPVNLGDIPDSWQEAVSALTKNQRLFAAFASGKQGSTKTNRASMN